MKAPGPMMTINVCLLGKVIFVFTIYALEISYARHFHMCVKLCICVIFLELFEPKRFKMKIYADNFYIYKIRAYSR